jgi:nicotinamidase-related amidase
VADNWNDLEAGRGDAARRGSQTAPGERQQAEEQDRTDHASNVAHGHGLGQRCNSNLQWFITLSLQGFFGKGFPVPADTLPFGPLTSHTAHLCVDMQTLFAERTDWHLPWLERVLPTVERIAAAHPSRTVFTRFIPPAKPEEMEGTWRRYYERWRQMTREELDPKLVELVPPLAKLVPPATVIDKRHYSPFTEPHLSQLLRARGIDSLVITGAETDVCVLAAVLGAVDRGFRVVLARDALCSAFDRTHDALLTLYQERFGQQIEVAPAEVILSNWS